VIPGIKVRNSIQLFLIWAFKINPFDGRRIFLFSKFMAGSNSGFFVTKGKMSGCNFLVHSDDTAASRRIFIGLDDEYLKAVKAIDWVKELKGYQITSFVDVGANLGHVCIPLITKGAVKIAVAFEPDPRNFKTLQCNLLMNGIGDQVVAVNSALGEFPEENLTLEFSDDNHGDHRIRVSKKSGLYNESQRQSISVRSTNFDTVLNNRELMGPTQEGLSALLIWIDVQGYEGAVVAGAVKALESKPAIALEFWPYGLERTNNFHKLLRNIKTYDGFYDLAQSNPMWHPLVELEHFYSKNKGIDSQILDILLV